MLVLLLLLVIIFIGVFVVPIAIVVKDTIPKKQEKPRNQNTAKQIQEPKKAAPTYVTIPQSVSPYRDIYRAKQLLTRTEQNFYNILKSRCSRKNLLICPKVRLEDFIEVTSRETYKYRGMIKSRHVDFLICNSNMKVIAGLELDDPTHNTQKAKEADKFKNELYSAIKIPLYRIKTNENYISRVERMIEEITEQQK